jgi:transcriptional regulator with XRE-family HTH domain
MIVTGDQIRMARVLLKLGVRDLSELAEVDKSTISRIENGGTSYSATLRQLRTICEDRGVLFIDPVEGVHAATVALKWGVAPPARQPGEDAAIGEAGAGGMKAAAWEDFDEDADANLDALLVEAPPPDPGMAEYWRTDPELWARLSEGGRETLSRSMFGDLRAVGAGYFQAETRGAAGERL